MLTSDNCTVPLAICASYLISPIKALRRASSLEEQVNGVCISPTENKIMELGPPIDGLEGIGNQASSLRDEITSLVAPAASSSGRASELECIKKTAASRR
jgi:hypothetical protein